MAFLLNNKSSLLSQLRSHPLSENPFARTSRGFHVELGEREKALLADDPALRRFKSHKQGVKKIRRMGDVLTIIVVAGCCYEIYVRATMREESRKAAKSQS